MKSTIVSLLTQHGVDKETVARWEKKCTPGMSQQFERLMGEIKEFDQTMGPVQPTTPTRSSTKPQTEKHSSGKRFSFGEGSATKSKASVEGGSTQGNKTKS